MTLSFSKRFRIDGRAWPVQGSVARPDVLVRRFNALRLDTVWNTRCGGTRFARSDPPRVEAKGPTRSIVIPFQASGGHMAPRELTRRTVLRAAGGLALAAG